MIPIAKYAILSATNVSRNRANVTPSMLKKILNNGIFSEGQIICCRLKHSSCGGDLNYDQYFAIERIFGKIERQNPENALSMYKITDTTQIFLDTEFCGFEDSRDIPNDLTSLTYGDIHATIRGHLKSRLSNAARLLDMDNGVSSILLVGPSGCAKSQIVREEAAAASVSILKIVPTTLLYLDEPKLSQALASLFTSAIISEPCVILIEAMELLKSAEYSCVQNVRILCHFIWTSRDI
jgi:hypothetical protein